MWNISQEGKTQEHIQESQSLFKLIDDRIKVYERQREVHVDMTELMMKQHKTITKKQLREQGTDNHEHDDTLLGFDAAQKAAMVLNKEKLKQIHGIETVEEKRIRIEALEAEAEDLRQLEEALQGAEISDEGKQKNVSNTDTLEPILGILVKTEYEQIAYR